MITPTIKCTGKLLIHYEILSVQTLRFESGYVVSFYNLFYISLLIYTGINSLRSSLIRRPFADDIFKCIFLNANEWILPRISLKYVPKVRINKISTLVQIMAWRRSGDKPLSEPLMVSLLAHVCVTRSEWVKTYPYKGIPALKHIFLNRSQRWYFSAKWTVCATRASGAT